jgi:hypothetical protein
MVLGGVLALLCLVSAIGLLVAARSDTGKKIFSVVGQGVAMAQKGLNAPGAAEIRAAGCPEGLVIDMADATKLAEVFVDGGFKTKDDEFDFSLVACSGQYGTTLPTCDELAPVYAKAVKSDRDFVIEVKHTGQKQADCSRRYSGDGTFLKDAK